MRILITGITGQDGSYLAEMMLRDGHQVIGIVRRTSAAERLWRLQPIFHRAELSLVEGDVTDFSSIQTAMRNHTPDEVYNLAAQSSVNASFANPTIQVMANAAGAINVMLAAHAANPKVRIYQASTSEMYGNAPEPQNELTPFAPRSPYGAAKLLAHHQARIFRQTYNMHVCCGILFNHESPRRGDDFVSRKIAYAAARFFYGDFSHKLELGYRDSVRDWGYAPDYVVAMPRMLRQDEPKDYVIATGESHSVQEWVDEAFAVAGVESDGLVVTNPEFVRPNEVGRSRGDASLARKELGWKPSIDFKGLVRLMVEAEIESLRTGKRVL